MTDNQQEEVKDMIDIGQGILKKKWNLTHFQALQLAAHVQSNLYLKRIARLLEEPVEAPAPIQPIEP